MKRREGLRMSMFVRVLMVWCLALGTVVLPLAADPASDLADQVPFQVWAYDALRYMVGWELIQGYPDGPLQSDRPMTRYEFACAWARLCEARRLQDREFSLNDVVTDVPENHWARGSVEKLAAFGVLKPSFFRDADTFVLWDSRPGKLDPKTTHYLNYAGDRPLLRGEYAQMAWRTVVVLRAQISATPYADVGMSCASHCIETGIVIGYPDGTVRLDEAMSRWQFFMATSRFLDATQSGPM